MNSVALEAAAAGVFFMPPTARWGSRSYPLWACCGQVRSWLLCGDDAAPDRAGCQDEEVQQAAEEAA